VQRIPAREIARMIWSQSRRRKASPPISVTSPRSQLRQLLHEVEALLGRQLARPSRARA
jgi:hypothetical protein